MPPKSKTPAKDQKDAKSKEEPVAGGKAKAKTAPSKLAAAADSDLSQATTPPQKVTYPKFLTSVRKITNKKEKTIKEEDLLKLFEDLNIKEVFNNQKNKKRANSGAKKHITIYNQFTSWIIKEMKDDINQQSKMAKAASIWTNEYKGNPAKIAEFKKKAGIVDA